METPSLLIFFAIDFRAATSSPCLHFPIGLEWIRSWEGSTMRNAKVAMLAYGLAVCFILAIAFHSPAKLLVADAPTTSSDTKQ
jgi:hypothetical protein